MGNKISIQTKSKKRYECLRANIELICLPCFWPNLDWSALSHHIVLPSIFGECSWVQLVEFHHKGGPGTPRTEQHWILLPSHWTTGPIDQESPECWEIIGISSITLCKCYTVYGDSSN